MDVQKSRTSMFSETCLMEWIMSHARSGCAWRRGDVAEAGRGAQACISPTELRHDSRA